MADTNFTDNVTPIVASWLNDINRLNYTIFGNPADSQEAVEALPLVTQITDGIMTAADKTKLDGIGGGGTVLFSIKTEDTTRLNTTAITDDPGLIVTVEADTFYSFEAYWRLDSDAAAPGIDYNLTPTGVTSEHRYLEWRGTFGNNNADLFYEEMVETATWSRDTPNSMSTFTFITGFVKTDVTSGDFAVQWGPAVANARFLTMKAGSWIKLTEI